MAFVISAFAALSGCEQNSFVPPPPPKVDVGLPVQHNVTRYLDATGNTAPIQTVDLVARVQGVLQSINYKDGSFVKQGHDAVHDRARNLQAETGAGPGGRGRCAGIAEAGRNRLQASGRPGRQAGRLAGDPRYVHVDARQRPGQSAAGPGQYQDRGDQLRLYQCRCAIRRHRQRASRLGRRACRRGVADAARDDRAT